MKKYIAFLAVLFLTAMAARAELLYFMVDSFDREGPEYNFDYALVGVAQSDGDGGWNVNWGDGGSKVYLQVKTDKGGTPGDYVDAVESGFYTVAGPAWADVSDYTSDGYAFYIETYGTGELSSDEYAGKQIWGFDENTAQTYAQLLTANHIYSDSVAAQNVTPWVVPEPTSGLLLLMGIAGLALRRRRGDSASRVSRLATSHEVRT